MEERMTFVQKIENYWYHYKWHTLLGVFALIIASVCVVQCAGNSEADAMIMYAGNFKIAEEYREKSFVSVMKEDYNKDGEKIVDVFQHILNIVEHDGRYDYYDVVAQNEELQRLEIEFSTGSSVIYILHPYIYGQYKNIMRPLSEIFTEIPEQAIDEYGIPLSALSVYQNTTLGFYPENAILCIRRKRTESNLISRADDEQYYENNVRFFIDLVEYK